MTGTRAEARDRLEPFQLNRDTTRCTRWRSLSASVGRCDRDWMRPVSRVSLRVCTARRQAARTTSELVVRDTRPVPCTGTTIHVGTLRSRGIGRASRLLVGIGPGVSAPPSETVADWTRTGTTSGRRAVTAQCKEIGLVATTCTRARRNERRRSWDRDWRVRRLVRLRQELTCAEV